MNQQEIESFKGAFSHPLLDAPLMIPGAAVDHWIIAEDWTYHSKRLDITITVKAGFISDLDSVPRIPIIYSQLKGYARLAAAMHDWIYAIGEDDDGDLITREMADDLFNEMMKIEEIDTIRRFFIYQGVNLFGWIHFKPDYSKVEHLYGQTD